MPQYYDHNANVGTAFASGLMTGYSFVENIRNRRRELQLQERALQRQEQNDKFNQDMVTRQDTRAQGQFEQNTTEHNLRMEYLPQSLQQQVRSGALSIEAAEAEAKRRPVLERQQDETFDLNQQVGRENLGAAREQRQFIRDQRKSLGDVTRRMLGPGDEPVSQTSTQQPAPGQVVSQTSTQQPNAVAAQTATTQTGPVDLNTVPAGPSFVDKAVSGVAATLRERRGKMANIFWKNAADPEAGASTAGPRLYPEKYVHRYRTERAMLDPEARASWDLTMINGLKRQGKDVPTWLTEPVKPAAPKELISNAGIKGSVKANDERVAQIAHVAAANAAADGIQTVTSNQLRLMSTQLGRASGKNRLSEQDVELFARAASLGVVSLDQIQNLQQYGTTAAPAAPKVIANFGGEYGALVQIGGRMVHMQPPGAKSKTKAETVTKGFNQAVTLVESEIARERVDLPKGSGASLVSDAWSVIASNPQAFFEKTGVNPLSEDGSSLNPGIMADPLVARWIVESQVRGMTGEDDPRESPMAPVGGAESITSMPGGGEQIMDLTSFFEAATN